MAELAYLGSLLGMPNILDPMFPLAYTTFFGSLTSGGGGGEEQEEGVGIGGGAIKVKTSDSHSQDSTHVHTSNVSGCLCVLFTLVVLWI